QKKPSARGKTFEQAYEHLRGENPLEARDPTPEAQTFKRIFTLPAGSDEERHAQIENLIEGLRQSVAQADGKYNVNLSLQGRTLDYNSPSALTQNRTTAPRAVYDPRIVGNDMGLWVTGRTWLLFVDEAQEDLQEYTQCPADNTCDLLKGLAALARGNGALAAELFARAAKNQPADPLAQLGLGTSAVINAQDEQALAYYQEVLKLDPKNKIAAKNIKVLVDDK
ncbi:MAG: hypothetical protein IKW71_00405, partial [Elusimicrobiaceae bacterium]|nr:hypothetical protein [Elusimicrobiaceae bacterium]